MQSLASLLLDEPYLLNGELFWQPRPSSNSHQHTSKRQCSNASACGQQKTNNPLLHDIKQTSAKRVMPQHHHHHHQQHAHDTEIVWTPAVDIRETPTAFEIIADLPGANKENIKLDITNEQVTLSGKAGAIPSSARITSSSMERPSSPNKQAPKEAAVSSIPTNPDGSEAEAEAEDEEEASTVSSHASNGAADNKSLAKSSSEATDAPHYKYLLTERRRRGHFCRYFRFPVELNAANATADFQNGILHVVIPKKPEEQPQTHSITIR